MGVSRGECLHPWDLKMMTSYAVPPVIQRFFPFNCFKYPYFRFKIAQKIFVFKPFAQISRKIILAENHAPPRENFLVTPT